MIWYGLTVFLSSAVLLVLEITAGRLIAPYVGSPFSSRELKRPRRPNLQAILTDEHASRYE